MDKEFKIPGIPEDLQETLKQRMADQYDFLFFEDGSPVIVRNIGNESKQLLRCKKTGNLFCGLSGFYVTGHHAYFTEDEQRRVWNWIELGHNKSRFEKAKKIKFSDWEGDQFFDGDNYQAEISDYLDEQFEEFGNDFDSYPKYVWATKFEPYIKPKDAWAIYENDIDRLGTEHDWKVDGIDKLQEALDNFVDTNSGNCAYFPDYTIALLLDEEIENFKNTLKEME